MPINEDNIVNIHKRIYKVKVPGFEENPVLIKGMDSLNNFMELIFKLNKNIELIQVLDTTKE